MSDYIFNGLATYQLDIIKLLIEDEDFFVSNIDTMDQNNMTDWVLRALVGMMKDVWQHEGVHLSYDSLISRSLGYFRDDFDRQMALEYLNTLRERVLEGSRIQEVKHNYKYWDLFYGVVKLTNLLSDSVKGGLKTLPELESIAKKAVQEAHNLENTLDKVVGDGGNNW